MLAPVLEGGLGNVISYLFSTEFIQKVQRKGSYFHVAVPEIKSPKKDVKPLGKLGNGMGNGDDGPKTAEDGAGKTVAGKEQKENPAGTSDEAAEKALSKYNSQSIVHLVAAQPRQQVAWATRLGHPRKLNSY